MSDREYKPKEIRNIEKIEDYICDHNNKDNDIVFYGLYYLCSVSLEIYNRIKVLFINHQDTINFIEKDSSLKGKFKC